LVRAFPLRKILFVNLYKPRQEDCEKYSEDLIGTLSNTLAIPWAASCGMSNTAIEMRMYGKISQLIVTPGTGIISRVDPPVPNGGTGQRVQD